MGSTALRETVRSIVTVGMAFLLTSCISQTDFAYLNDQVNILARQVAELRRSQEALERKLGTDLEASLSGIRASQAELSADMDQTREEIRKLSGRVEDNEHMLRRVVERDLGQQDVFKERVASLDERVSDLEILIKGSSAARLPRTRPKEEGQRRVASEGTRKERPPVSPPPLKEKKKSPELELYDASMASYKKGRYEEAMMGFREFLKKYPASDLADNAHFWIGESLMALKQYEKAILAYQDVIKKYPRGNKVPNAMLRQAMAFLEIKDRISAKLLLKKIIKKYPRSNEAKIAQVKLRQLK
ncbi:MAG: tol-pal system protein YbgF [Deltaproteobacteria bacterium]|nr:tol-pal system protein YbgF [Deltaproteobacteria bacterium]